MKHIALIAVLIIASLDISAQTLESIKRVLKNRDFRTLSSIVNSQKSIDLTTGSQNWRQRQEITPGFEASVITIDEYVPVKDDPASWIVREYWVNLISTGSEIIYYDFIETLFDSVADTDIRFVFDSFENRNMIDSMRSSFFRLYQAWPEEYDMFKDGDVYGFFCDEGGTPPPGRLKLDSILARKNYGILDKWLRSANIADQLYAIDGLYQLMKAGRRPAPEQARIIEIIRQKQGIINICIGCGYDSMPFSEIVESVISGKVQAKFGFGR